MTTRDLLLAILLLSASVCAQNQASGEIRLEVKDQAGNSLIATGKLENLATGVRRSFQTDAQGHGRPSGLSFGRYRLEVALQGFTPQVVLIDVQTAVPITRSVTLTLGGLAFQVDVVAATPLPGSDLSADQIAGPIQAAPLRAIQASQALDISDFLNRRLRAVNLNEIQGNPYQADLNYRGYTASPLLGTPQGLSVYLDGVRLNQPFGDVVSWDLIPRVAVAEVALVPGSNPLFGLNTLVESSKSSPPKIGGGKIAA